MALRRVVLSASLALSLSLLALACLDDSAVGPAPGSNGARIALRATVVGARAGDGLEVAILYARTDESTHALGDPVREELGTGTTEVPITVNLGPCLADALHAGGDGACMLSARVTLVDEAGLPLDVQTVAIGAIREGMTTQAPAVTVRRGDLSLEPGTMAFAGRPDAPVPEAQTVTVARSNGGALGELSVETSYETGQDWLAVAPTGPATLTLGPTTTALAAGVYRATVRVTASSAARTLDLPVTYTLDPNVPTSIEIAVATTSLQAGTTTAATATVRDQNGEPMPGQTVVWRSSATGVVSPVQQSPLSATLEALAPGTADVTAEIGELRSRPTAITVTPGDPASVAITVLDHALTQGQTTTAAAVVRDGRGNELADHDVDWSTSAAGVATVASAGVRAATVLGVGAGSAGISAVVRGFPAVVSNTEVVTVTVVAPPARPVARIVVSEVIATDGAPLPIDATREFQATLYDAAGAVIDPADRTIGWTVANASVLALEPASGPRTTVRATLIGATDLVAASEGQSGSASVEVVPAITVLPGLGGSFAEARDGNAAGQVTGYAETGDGTVRAFRWSAATGTQPLALLPGGREGIGVAMNDNGDVAGLADSAGVDWPVLWTSDGPLVQLSFNGGGIANDVNNSRQVALSLFDGDGGFLAYAWSPGEGLVPLGIRGEALAVNGFGAITGEDESDGRAFIWRSGADLRRRAAIAPDDYSLGFDINSSEEVAGYSCNLEASNCAEGGWGQHAVLWSANGTPRNQDIANSRLAEAWGINEAGQSAGWVDLGQPDGTFPRMWLADGTPYDLNLLPGYSWGIAYDINSSGRVFGAMMNGEGSIAVIWKFQADGAREAITASTLGPARSRTVRAPIAGGTPFRPARALAPERCRSRLASPILCRAR
jgi:probable HAF family extracellular repeat protein